jgi:VIT1/CCC1 family predicted Fe2+/Mn2+ transporter
VHVVFDYLLGALLIAAPFLFGFSGETAPTALFIAVGALHLVITTGTRFRGPEPEPEPAEFVLRDPDGPAER